MDNTTRAGLAGDELRVDGDATKPLNWTGDGVRRGDPRDDPRLELLLLRRALLLDLPDLLEGVGDRLDNVDTRGDGESGAANTLGVRRRIPGTMYLVR